MYLKYPLAFFGDNLMQASASAYAAGLNHHQSQKPTTTK